MGVWARCVCVCVALLFGGNSATRTRTPHFLALHRTWARVPAPAGAQGPPPGTAVLEEPRRRRWRLRRGAGHRPPRWVAVGPGRPVLRPPPAPARLPVAGPSPWRCPWPRHLCLRLPPSPRTWTDAGRHHVGQSGPAPQPLPRAEPGWWARATPQAPVSSPLVFLEYRNTACPFLQVPKAPLGATPLVRPCSTAHAGSSVCCATFMYLHVHGAPITG